ncbi:MAG: hypothetical protein SF162_01240 [bacterium]|nr:hypothetical protein [bacterium]
MNFWAMRLGAFIFRVFGVLCAIATLGSCSLIFGFLAAMERLKATQYVYPQDYLFTLSLPVCGILLFGPMFLGAFARAQHIDWMLKVEYNTRQQSYGGSYLNVHHTHTFETPPSYPSLNGMWDDDAPRLPQRATGGSRRIIDPHDPNDRYKPPR